MKTFIFGIIFGSAVSAVGFGSIAPILDSGINAVQQTTVNLVRNNSAPPAPILPANHIY